MVPVLSNSIEVPSPIRVRVLDALVKLPWLRKRLVPPLKLPRVTLAGAWSSQLPWLMTMPPSPTDRPRRPVKVVVPASSSVWPPSTEEVPSKSVPEMAVAPSSRVTPVPRNSVLIQVLGPVTTRRPLLVSRPCSSEAAPRLALSLNVRWAPPSRASRPVPVTVAAAMVVRRTVSALPSSTVSPAWGRPSVPSFQFWVLSQNPPVAAPVQVKGRPVTVTLRPVAP